MPHRPAIAIIGAGFAGSEAAWQIAVRGYDVALYEMRPHRSTQAHSSGYCAELVCSNSFKSLNTSNAHGLLKAEMERQGSMILSGARQFAVPAGQALAVDRDLFAHWVTDQLERHPRIHLLREPVENLATVLSQYRIVVIATGPLTDAALARNIEEFLGESNLAFYDAIAPTVLADSIDTSLAFRASRYGKGDDDYLNCPLDEAQYYEFVNGVLNAETLPLHEFETLRPFEGCLPIEVMAQRGPLTLAYGPMKPVGLSDPRSAKQPFAVLQLRQENRQATLYGMVGFQTKMTWPEQRRLFRTIPGLEQAEFARLGSMHRNTFIQSPRVLDADLACRKEPRLFFAGQIAGVEGYMESTAMGLYAGKRIAFQMAEKILPRPSAATMTGGLLQYITQTEPEKFQPMNSNFGLLQSAPPGIGKARRKAFYAERALAEIDSLEKLEQQGRGNSQSTADDGYQNARVRS